MESCNTHMQLRPAESILCELLLDFAQNFTDLDIWITGAFVRDRLLGLPTSGLEISLRNVEATSFGKALQVFVETPEIVAKYQPRAASLGVSAKLTGFHSGPPRLEWPREPETAGGLLLGIDIEFVGLLAAICIDLTIPLSETIGTPENNAFSRDTTIDSLFFSLREKKVFDYTGKGIDDLLRKKTMRTPCDPWKTFLINPLRMLRVIRLGSKLYFPIEPTVMDCMKDAQLHAQLDKQRDEIRIELLEIMKNDCAALAFQSLHDVGLYGMLFYRRGSPMLQDLRPWLSSWPRVIWLLNALFRHRTNLCRMVQADENAGHLWTLAAYVPPTKLPDTKFAKATREMRYAIKPTAHVEELLRSALQNFKFLQAIVERTSRTKASSRNKKEIGVAMCSVGHTWTTQLTYALLAEAYCADASKLPRSNPAECDGTEPFIDPFLDPVIAPVVAKYSEFADFLHDSGLRQLRPLISKHDIRVMFGQGRRNTFTDSLYNGVIAWQLDNPTATTEEATKWLLTH